MSPIQVGAIAATFGLPPLMARVGSSNDGSDRRIRRTLAAILLLLELAGLAAKLLDGTLTLQQGLPMQLCDWALFASCIALTIKSQTAFDLSYFWGLAGTFQALFTPAIGAHEEWWRLLVFFAAHSGIVIAVLYLAIARHFRPVPGSLLRIAFWSEIYLLSALLVNRLVHSNYGFLTRRPEVGSMLNLFSPAHRRYVVELNLFAFGCFLILYLPWLIYDLARPRRFSETGRRILYL